MFHVKQNNTLKLGNKIAILGEDIAVRYLRSKNYIILTRNYLEKTGEIDIICTKDSIIYFVEVKTRSSNNLSAVNTSNIGVFEMVTSKKIAKMTKTIELYLLKNGVSHETKWQMLAVGVYVDQIRKESKVILIDNLL